VHCGQLFTRTREVSGLANDASRVSKPQPVAATLRPRPDSQETRWCHEQSIAPAGENTQSREEANRGRKGGGGF
jgi:hypothetical protein